jgi:DNA excision repair protein ERCC-4
VTAKTLCPVLIDTREQAPWSFSIERCTTERKAVPYGDYSIAGYDLEVSIERKELNDFVNTIIWDWQRFRRELRRLATYRFTCIAVEANVADVGAHKYRSETNPHSILGRALAIELDYGVPVHFWGSRAECRWMAERYLLLAWERLRNPFAIHPCEIPGAV